ncbi:MAG: right-handed parallel beta-helix repeat-containing protein [Verrucomicrobiia bacterium]
MKKLIMRGVSPRTATALNLPLITGLVVFIFIVFLLSITGKIIAAEQVNTSQDKTNSEQLLHYPRVDLRFDCGARGNGKANDTQAFQKAASIIQEAGGGTLIIPKGVYIVGRQNHTDGKYPYYQAESIFQIKGVKFLRIEGNGAVVRVASGLRFGSFDKDSGEPFQPPKMPFVDNKYAAYVGHIINISHSQNIHIQDLELDGNLGGLIIGGQYGDTGRQLPACGIFIHNCADVRIERVHSHHNALDGIMIGWYHLKESDPPTPHTLVDSLFEYNGRQGLSWIGGRGIRAYRCKFNYTGHGLNNGKPFVSAPGAGLDIEAEDSVCRDGYFEECEFINNVGCGMVADSGDGGYSRFVRCTFWGISSWSAWSAKPGIIYEDCAFYGSVVHAFGSDDPALATRWIRCSFEDRNWKNGEKPYGKFLAELNGKLKNVTFQSCQFTANQRRSIWCSGEGFKMIDSVFTHKYDGVPEGDYQAILRGGEIAGCHFKEEFPQGVKSHWSILVDGSRVVGEKPTVVDGPCVRWGSSRGWVGEILPNK